MSKRKTIRVPLRESGKAERSPFGERFEEQEGRGDVVIRVRARNAVNMRVFSGELLIQVSDG